MNPMPTVTSSLRRLLACTAPLALAACTVGPNYVRPAPLPAAQATPAEFKESLGWRPATPVAELDKGAWWSVFNDPLLDQLERKVAVTNQSVASAEANYRQAVAVVEEARAGFLPTVGLSSSLTHSGGGSASNGAVVTTGGTTVVTGSGAGTIGGTTGTTGTGTTGTTGTTGSTTSGTGSTGGTSFVTSGGSQTRYSIGADASWVLDVWGRIRRTVESDRATAQASAADLANATLSAQATLAADYFNVRAADDQIRILNENVVTYRRSLQITQNQYAAGTVARADVIAAQSQVLTAQASLIDFGRQRTANEHAVAILAGEAPAALTIPVGALPRVSPTPPAGLTTALLERRPDIAGAERAMQATNAQIGVAVAAYYPEISLSGSAKGWPVAASASIRAVQCSPVPSWLSFSSALSPSRASPNAFGSCSQARRSRSPSAAKSTPAAMA